MSTTEIPAVIQPTVGCIVWYHRGRSDSPLSAAQGPLAAIVCKVHDDRRVSLLVIGPDGSHHRRIRVPLKQPDTDIPEGASFCAWMPRQMGEAAKSDGKQQEIEEYKNRIEELENRIRLMENEAAQFSKAAERLESAMSKLIPVGGISADVSRPNPDTSGEQRGSPPGNDRESKARKKS